MNRLVKKFMVVLMSAFMFLGAVTTPVQAKGRSSDNPNGWGFWWGWWWPTEPTPEPTPEPVEEPVVDEEPGADEETPVETEEPVVEETPVETEEPAVEETPVETEEPVVEETLAAEPEPVYAEGTFFDESEHFVATVSFDATAKLPEGTDVSVSELQEGTPEYDAAVKAVFGDGAAAADFIAVDISLVSDDVVVEPDPNGNEVTVSVELKNLPVEAIAAADTMEIQHVNEVSGETETVATAENITVTGEDSAQAEFAVGSFSTFVLKWGDNSATIHYGYIENGAFTEFANEKVAVLDTTAASVSLANYFDQFAYSSATYVASEGADPVLVDPVLYKTDNGWAADMHISEGEDSSTVTRTAIANGSNIYVVYAKPQSHPESTDDVAGPTTTKEVTPNGDGTYTIQLDVTGTVKQESHSTGANVLIILDRTTSMTWSMKGQGHSITADNPERWATAVSAIKTLVNTLSTGENAGNDIDYSLVTFYRKADDIYKWSGNSWTKDYSAYLETIDKLGQNSGTNWEAGLAQGYNALANRDSDKTYVIFVTDGEPNRSNTSHNPWDGGWSYVTDAQEEANSIAASNNVSLYGVFCGGDAGVDNLTNIINNAGGVKTINGTDEKTMQDEFKNIAQTIIDNLGSSDVSVDDGIPSLSSVSAQTSGEAGGFEYYIATKENPSDTDFTKWDKAPGASYSKDNGVTWDLSEVGNLADKTTYRLKFTVWPSQDAYDYIADLNNGKVDPVPDEATLLSQGIIKDASGVYKLKTNTHLNTTYTYNGETYTDPSNWEEKAMDLPTETISVKKLWNNALDQRSVDAVQLIVTKDGEEYLNDPDKTTVSEGNNWTVNGIYISMGQITVHNGVATVIEPGHDYTIIEPEGLTYHWELSADVYHPMVVNGTATNLVLDKTATAADNVKTFEINGKFYTKKTGEDANLIKATNDRRSFLDITKVVEGTGAPADAKFEYTITIDNPKGTHPSDGEKYDTDDDFWFDITTVADPETALLDMDVTGATAEVRDGNLTGYWYAPNGSTVTIKMQADWNVRFTNLRSGTTYEVEESSAMDPGFVFEKAAPTVNGEGTAATVTDRKAKGTIDKPNTDYKVTYTNKYLGFFYVYHSSDNTVVRYPMAENGVKVTSFNVVEKTYDNTLYGGYYTNYAGKSAGFDVKKLNFTDNKATDTGEGVTKYDYDYIKTSNQSVWNINEANTANGEKIVPVTDAVYYLKEVPTGYLQPYLHYTYYKANNNISTAWLISAVDDNNYGEYGFIIISDNRTAQICKSLSLSTTNGGKAVKLNAKRVYNAKGVLAGYLTYRKVINDTDGTAELKNGDVVKQYWVTPDKIRVTGTAQRSYKSLESKTGIGVNEETTIKSEIKNLN